MNQKSQLWSRSQPYIVWVAASALLLFASLDGLSRYLEALNPTTALALNPFNADARVKAISNALNDPAASGELNLLKSQILTGLRTDPVDARFYGLLGELYLKEGETDQADQRFEHAHKLARTELHALQYLIMRSAEEGDYGRTVARIDILFRRWPDKFAAVAPAMPTLLAQDTAYLAVLKAMTADAPWRTRLLSALAKEESGLGFASRLLLDLESSGSRPSQHEITAVVNGFLRKGRYQEAYRLFLFTMPADERALSGHVHNSSFAESESTQAFAWQYQDSSAAEIRLSANAVDQGARVRFLNKPAREITLKQNLMLTPGRYRLTIEATASNLTIPRGLFWTIGCVETNQEISRLDVAEGSYKSRQFIVEFDMGECKAQSIRLKTGLVAESWRYRYGGRIVFHKVYIERADLDQTQG